MSGRIHLLFAPGKPWKVLPPGYERIHSQLRREIRGAGQSDKRIRHRRQSKQFKQTGEIHG